MEEIMELMYQSTRSEGTKVTASQAILKGLAGDGGLFVPESIPALDISWKLYQRCHTKKLLMK